MTLQRVSASAICGAATLSPRDGEALSLCAFPVLFHVSLSEPRRGEECFLLVLTRASVIVLITSDRSLTRIPQGVERRSAACPDATWTGLHLLHPLLSARNYGCRLLVSAKPPWAGRWWLLAQWARSITVGSCDDNGSKMVTNAPKLLLHNQDEIH